MYAEKFSGKFLVLQPGSGFQIGFFQSKEVGGSKMYRFVRYSIARQMRERRCDECVVAGQNVFLGPTIHLHRPDCCVESHHLHLLHAVYCILLFPDAFSKGGIIPTCSPRSEFTVTPVTSRPEDAFIDLTANSILGATTLSKAVKIAFCILSSTVSTKLLISLSILLLKHLSKVFTLAVLSLAAVLLLEVLTVKSRSLVP